MSREDYNNNCMKSNINYKLVVLIITITSLLASCKNSFEKAKSTEIICEYIECCKNIKEQKLIGDLVLNADSWAKRRTALDYLTDKTILEKVSKESCENDVVYFAKERLKAIETGQPLDKVPVVVFHYYTSANDMNSDINHLDQSTTFKTTGVMLDITVKK